MNRDMPSKGKDPVANLCRIAHLRREIKRLQYLLVSRKGLGLLLRFRIKLYMINLRHELKQLT